MRRAEDNDKHHTHQKHIKDMLDRPSEVNQSEKEKPSHSTQIDLVPNTKQCHRHATKSRRGVTLKDHEKSRQQELLRRERTRC